MYMSDNFKSKIWLERNINIQFESLSLNLVIGIILIYHIFFLEGLQVIGVCNLIG